MNKTAFLTKNSEIDDNTYMHRLNMTGENSTTSYISSYKKSKKNHALIIGAHGHAKK